MNVSAYLDRIGCADCLAPSLARLRQLQRGHMLHVPYETFDLRCGQVPDLSAEALYEKIVTRRRGGYCFELNGAYRWLLQRLGYDVRQHFGRWLFGESLAVPPPRHRVLRVTLEGRTYVTDAGIGMRAPLEPLELAYDKVQTSAGWEWRIVRDARFVNLVQVNVKGTWTNYFSFGDESAEDADFLYVNHYLASEPSSMFRHRFLVFLPLADGGARSLAPEDDPETGRSAWCFEQQLPDGTVDKTYLHTEARRAAALVRGFGLPPGLARSGASYQPETERRAGLCPLR